MEFFNDKPQNSLKHVVRNVLLLIQLNAWHGMALESIVSIFCSGAQGDFTRIYRLQLEAAVNRPKPCLGLVAPFLLGQMQFCIAKRHFLFIYAVMAIPRNPTITLKYNVLDIFDAVLFCWRSKRMNCLS